MSGIVEATHLSRRFGDRDVLRDLSFGLDPGEAVALLGPNGAGKTTAIRCLLGLLRPDGGTIKWTRAGDPRSWTGYAAQDTGVYNQLTVRENLRFLAAVHRIRNTDNVVAQIVDAFDLGAISGRRSSRLSGGQRRRLHLAAAFVHQPSLVVLDEPTSSLDAYARLSFYEWLHDYKARGGSVLLITHDMDEAESLLDRVIVLHSGVVVADQSKGAFVERHGSTSARFRLSDATPPPRTADRGSDGWWEITGPDSATIMTALVRWSQTHQGAECEDLRFRGSGLGSAYLNVLAPHHRPTGADD